MKKIHQLILVTTLTINCLLITINSFAQDIHFTMYDIMPMTLNPATTGVFGGDVRAVINYRSQWGSIGNPYKTFAFGIDGSLLKNKWRNGYIGIGLNAFKDVAGAANFGTTKINLAVSSVLFLDKKNSAVIGLMGTWAQNSLDPNNLQWSNQFDGQSYDGTVSSNEQFAFENTNYFDFSTGALWTYGKGAKTLSTQDELKVQAGLAFYHVARPSQQIKFGDLDKLYSKWAFHTESHIGLSSTKLAVRPKLLVMLQGPTREITVGTMFRYTLQEKSKYTGAFKGMAISVGGYYRVGDAFSPSVEFEVAHFAVGFAYDLNTSGLTAATGGQGGPEIYIKFTNPNPMRRRTSTARFN